MPTSIDQILPSLEALGLWSYWIIGLASMFEAFFVTGVFIPGTLVVDTGGVLVQQGALDYFDLVWFVTIGSILGGEAGYWVGTLARRGLESRWHPGQSPGYQRAERLFRRHGGFALVLGRFLGPVSGLVPFAASVAGMDRRKFLVWNIVSGFPYALAHVAFGYFLGDIIARLGPLATRLALFAAAVALVAAVLWWLVLRIERLLPFVLSIGGSIVRAIAENPDMRAWAANHPRIARLTGSRFDTSHFGGLPATLLAFVALYIFIIWLASVLDFLMADPIVAADTRLANLVHAFWTPGLLRFFAHVTALGDWRVIVSLLLAAISILSARRRPDLVVGLVVALAGNDASVALLKKIFARPRPELAYFVEATGSFPSGHAAISVASFGMLFYAGWRLRWLGPIMAAVLASILAFLIGLSRIYLIEHYLTDVLNGFLVGALWLVIGIAIAEWWQETRQTGRKERVENTGRRVATALLALTLSGTAVWFVATYDKARNMLDTPHRTETITDPAAIFTSGAAPASTESIAGTPLEPINVIIVAKDHQTFLRALKKAAWIRAENPGVLSLGRALWAAWTNAPDGNAPVTPYFWGGAPNDYAFQRSTQDNSPQKRHHIRFWQSRFQTPAGAQVFVGAASFDNGFDWNFLHHIDPNVDAERDTLSEDLKKAAVVAEIRQARISTPRLGESVSGDPWFTDGMATILVLR